MKNLIKLCVIAVALAVTLPAFAADSPADRIDEWKKARGLAATEYTDRAEMIAASRADLAEWRKARALAATDRGDSNATTRANAQSRDEGAKFDRQRNPFEDRYRLITVPNIPAGDDTQQSDVPWWLNSDEWAATGQDDPEEGEFGDEDNRIPGDCPNHNGEEDHEDDDSSSVSEDESPCDPN